MSLSVELGKRQVVISACDFPTILSRSPRRGVIGTETCDFCMRLSNNAHSRSPFLLIESYEMMASDAVR